MSLKIAGGLFKHNDGIDHHAILCVPVDADIKEVRKSYLKIARRLHPDSSKFVNDAERNLAHEFLSKLVNPAYEKLSLERNRAEYSLVLSQIGKRLAPETVAVEITTEVAKKLAIAPNIDLLYKNAIAKIAETQFDDLQQTPLLIAQISELNLVYLMRRTGRLMTTPQLANSSTPPPPPPPPPPPKEDPVVEQYLRRAETLIEKNQFAQAKVELQDALKLNPKNSHGHSLMGLVYLRQNQLKMARIHFENVLKLDPNDKLALEWKPKLDKVLGKKSETSHVNSSPDNSGSGGLFGGLFGGKKK